MLAWLISAYRPHRKTFGRAMARLCRPALSNPDGFAQATSSANVTYDDDPKPSRVPALGKGPYTREKRAAAKLAREAAAAEAAAMARTGYSTFHDAWFFGYGGAGMVFSAGLFERVPGLTNMTGLQSALLEVREWRGVWAPGNGGKGRGVGGVRVWD